MNVTRGLLMAFTALLMSQTSTWAQATPAPPAAAEICTEITSATPIAGTPPASADAPAADLDLVLIDAILPHLRAGIDLATVAAGLSERPEIDQIATSIIDSRQLAIVGLESGRAEWFKDAPTLDYAQLVAAMNAAMSDSPGAGGLAGLVEMDPTHIREEVASLCGSGDQVDISFIDLLIRQNSTAIILYREAINRANHTEIAEVARSLLDMEQYEIDQVLTWREQWFPGTPITDDHGI